MKTYTKDKLSEILRKHHIWLNRAPEGERADLSGADLSGADLSYADLSYADLSYADLSGADLSYADLSYADLSRADLSYANLSYADLSYADLSYADLSRADLSYANLSYADLSHADLSRANLSYANLAFNVFLGGARSAPVYQACRGFGSRNATLTLLAQGEPSEWVFFTGCFRGTRTELEAAVTKTHGGTPEQANYLRAIEYLWQTALSNR